MSQVARQQESSHLWSVNCLADPWPHSWVKQWGSEMFGYLIGLCCELSMPQMCLWNVTSYMCHLQRLAALCVCYSNVNVVIDCCALTDCYVVSSAGSGRGTLHNRVSKLSLPQRVCRCCRVSVSFPFLASVFPSAFSIIHPQCLTHPVALPEAAKPRGWVTSFFFVFCKC